MGGGVVRRDHMAVAVAPLPKVVGRSLPVWLRRRSGNDRRHRAHVYVHVYRSQFCRTVAMAVMRRHIRSPILRWRRPVDTLG